MFCRFLEAIKEHPLTLDKCWTWQGPTNNRGYGFIYDNGKKGYRQAHRYSFECYRHKIPEGLTIDHLCRVRNCVNPWHMEIVTRAENTMRGDTVTAGNKAKTHCKHGHPFDEENTFYRPTGGRSCRTCMRKRARERQRRIRAAAA